MSYINIYGAGLAGCEAAWQAARMGVRVRLFEMKPKKFTPAHHSEGFAELVCSNSLRSDSVINAVGLLKEEMARCGSLTIEAARTRKREDILRAVMLEPHTAAELSIDDMAKMVDELIEAHGEYMAMYR